MSKILSIALFCVVMFSGCMLGPDYERPYIQIPAPDQEQNLPDEIFYQGKWWELFSDPYLNILEEEALKNNRNLHIAIARVDEAMALAGVAFADRLPRVGLGFTGARQQVTEGEASRYGPNASRMQNAWQAAGIFSFELDLWGKYRRLDEAAKAELLATEANRDTIRLTLTAEVANAYFMMRSLEAQHEIAQNTVGGITFIDIFEVYDGNNRIVMFQIPAAVISIPTSWKGHYYGRDGESLSYLSLAVTNLSSIMEQQDATVNGY